jgi:hypothetical protein
MHTEIVPLVLVKLPFGCLVTKFCVTGRKDEYHEVDEFICNGCRFDHKEVADWKDQELLKKIR